jgi:hypothetical protein
MVNSKSSKLLEILNLIEDDKARMGTFIKASDFDRISDEERKKWIKKSEEAAHNSNEVKQFYYANRALGIPHLKALGLAKDAQKKEWGRLSSEHDAFKQDQDKGGSSGFEKVSGGKEDASDVLKRRETVLNMINDVSAKFKGSPDAQKVLALNLIQHGFDEIIPVNKIPFYNEISQVLHKEDAKKTRRQSFALVTGKPPDGLGVNWRVYYKVVDYLKQYLKDNPIAESFMSGLSSLFGDTSGKNPTEFKLSNLEPMVDIIKRDINNYKFKGYGLHLQGVTTEEGEDMLRDIPNIKHQYQGDALLVPLEGKTNLKNLLKKAIPGKRVLLFGYDTKPQPIRKGWEGFQYKLVKNPTVVGSYTLSSESRSESLVKYLSEGFQCQHYRHSTTSCGLIERPCDWKGFAGIGEDMKRECLDYR